MKETEILSKLNLRLYYVYSKQTITTTLPFNYNVHLDKKISQDTNFHYKGHYIENQWK